MENTILELMKHELGVQTENHSFDDVFKPYIALAIRNVRRECNVDGSIEMELLLAKYAAYLWKDRQTGAPLPKMIRSMLNDFTFKQKGDGTGE